MTNEQQANRPFGIFEVADEELLTAQCLHDLKLYGFDSFQCRRKAERIIDYARSEARSAESETPIPRRTFDSIRGEGVTIADYEWYWGLPTIARAAMIAFEREMIFITEFLCYPRNLGVADLELDIRRSLQTFSEVAEETGIDAPLPAEIRRRFMIFADGISTNEQALGQWHQMVQESSSMNAAFRELIRKGEA